MVGAQRDLRAIMAEAPKVMANPKDYQARANIMWCGTLAHNGVCGCGRTEDWSSHAMEHEISALYCVTHGAGLAVVFPAFMTYMAMHKPWRVTQMARRVFDVDICNDVAAATEGIRRLRAFCVTSVSSDNLGDNCRLATTRIFFKTLGMMCLCDVCGLCKRSCYFINW